VLKTKVVEKIETQILYQYFFFLKSCRLLSKVGKYCGTWQTADDDIAHAHCMLDT